MPYTSDTFFMSIKAAPAGVFDFLANVNNWPLFSIFAQSVSRIDDTHWIVHSPHGNVEVVTAFDKEHGILDHYIRPAESSEDFLLIPYRVVPNGSGAELMITIFNTSDKYDEHKKWVPQELAKTKKYLENQ